MVLILSTPHAKNKTLLRNAPTSVGKDYEGTDDGEMEVIERQSSEYTVERYAAGDMIAVMGMREA